MATWKRAVSRIGGRRVIAALGTLYAVIGAIWVLAQFVAGTPLGSVLFIFVLIGGPGFVLLYGAFRLPGMDVRPEFYPDIVGRCLAGLGVMLVILTLYHLQPEDSLRGSFQTVLILTSLSTATGFAIGIHDARAKTRAHELELRNQELQRTKARLEETVGRLEASNERLEHFAYAASHDLQEPLRMVTSYLRLLERRYGDDLDEDGEEFVAFAVDGAERMREMIEGLLAYSRIESQGEPFGPVDLEAVLADVQKDLEVSIAESGADVEIEALPRVHGDEGQLRQVLQNLVANAIEYSEGEAPRVSVFADENETGWTVSVRDEGIGIEPDDRERIFQVFQRLHGYDEHAGTGIGLALCKRIVERHGGDIWVDSEPSEGSTFSFTLPRCSDYGP